MTKLLCSLFLRFSSYSVAIFILFFLSSCGLSEDEVRATVVAQLTNDAPTVTNSSTPTLTPTPTSTLTPSPTPTDTKTPTPTKTSTATKTPSDTSTPGPSSTPTNTRTPRPTKTPNPVSFDFDSLCSYLANMSDIEQRAWVQQNRGKSVGPWRGRVIYYYKNDSVLFHIDGKGDYPWGNTVNLSFPTKEYLINRIYDFYGELFSISGSRSGCISIILADENERKSKLVEP